LARPRFLFGRVLALLLVGIAIGAVLFLKRHLNPTAIEAQVREALDERIALRWELDEVILDLGTGVEIRGLRVFYPDGARALDLERVVVTVDQQRLLRGEVSVRQVDFYAPQLLLRPEIPGNPPSLPGLLKPTPTAGRKQEDPIPAIRVLEGSRRATVTLEAAPLLDASCRPQFEIVSAEGRSDGPLYTADLEVRAEGFGTTRVGLRRDGRSGIVEARCDVTGVEWRREDLRRLAPGIRDAFERVALAGRASLSAQSSLGPAGLASFSAEARVEGLEADFGGFSDASPARPFRIENGACTVEADLREVKVRGFRGDFVPRSGRRGRIEAEVRKDIATPSAGLDIRILTRDIHVSLEDARLLVPPELIEDVIERYRPEGLFDIDLSITQRTGLAEKLIFDLLVREGRIDFAGDFDAEQGRRLGFDYPIDQVTGRVLGESNRPTPHGPVDSVVLRRVKGSREGRRGGRMTAEGSGRILTWKDPARNGAQDASIDIVARDVPIDETLEAGFRATAKGLPYRKFDLRGLAERVEIRIRRDGLGDDVTRSTYEATVRDCSLAYRPFPLHADEVAGRILVRERPPEGDLPERTEMSFLGFRGRARDGGEIAGGGTILQVEGRPNSVDLRIDGTDIALGPDLGEVLSTSIASSPDLVDFWIDARPEGTVDAEIRVTGADEAKVAILLDGDLRLRGFRSIDLPVEELRGRVEYDGERVDLREVRGVARGTEFEAGGWVADGLFELNARVPGLALTPALRESVRGVWGDVRLLDRFDLSEESTLDLSVHARRRSAGEAPEVAIELARLSLLGRAGGFDVRAGGGPIRIAAGRVLVHDLEFVSADASVYVREAEMALRPGAGGRVLFDGRNMGGGTHLSGLFGPGVGRTLGENLRADFDHVEMLFNRPDGRIVLTGGVMLRRHEATAGPRSALEPTGSFRLAPVTLTPPRDAGDPLLFSGLILFKGVNFNVPFGLSDLTGQLLVGEGTIGRGISMRGAVRAGDLVLYKRHLRDASMNIDVSPAYLRLREIEGNFYGGRLRGDFEVHLERPSAFQLGVRIEEADIGKMLRQDLPPGEEMAGRLDAALELASPSGAVDHLVGRGEIRIRDGALLEVPTLRMVLSVLGRVTPIKSASRFKNADIDFDIEGENVEVKRFHLSTAVNDIRGWGVISLYGDLSLVVEPQVTRVLDLPRFLNLPVLSSIRNLWHRTVYEVRLEGTIDSPSVRLRALPFLKQRERLIATQARHPARVEPVRPPLLPWD
jgi:hypothetical protein